MSTNNNIRRRAYIQNPTTGEEEGWIDYEYPRNIPSVYSSTYQTRMIAPGNITDADWPEDLISIGPFTFCGAQISAEAFNNLPSSVAVIHGWAFRHNLFSSNGGASLVLPESIEYIGEYAFYSCGISSLIFPANKTIYLHGVNVFSNNNFTSITVPDTTKLIMTYSYDVLGTYWTSNGNNYLGKNYIYYKGTMPNNTDITLDYGTVTIAPKAFQNKTTLRSIVIPDTVEFIGQSAFSGCTGLTEFTFPAALRSIHADVNQNNYKYAVFYNSSSSGTTINNVYSNYYYYSPFATGKSTGITTINYNSINFHGYSSSSSLVDTGTTNDYCFVICGTYLTNVTTINIGSNVTRIPSNFISKTTKVTSLTIPSGVTSIGFKVIYSCTGLTTLNYNAIDAERASNSTGYLFGDNGFLTTVNIGNNVQKIPACFLRSATAVTSIDLPASVTSIGNYAFNGCSSLTSITIRATTPPTLDSSYANTFPTTSQNYTIYVPASVVNTYKTTSKWSTWASKIQAIPS